jgi:hypothetical protein
LSERFIARRVTTMDDRDAKRNNREEFAAEIGGF